MKDNVEVLTTSFNYSDICKISAKEHNINCSDWLDISLDNLMKRVFQSNPASKENKRKNYILNCTEIILSTLSFFYSSNTYYNYIEILKNYLKTASFVHTLFELALTKRLFV